MVALEGIEFLLQLSTLLLVCSHAGVVIVQLSHDLVDNDLGVSADAKSLNPEFSGDAQIVD
jgi:hypothetical protein